MSATTPSVLLVYYTYTGQTRAVVEAMAEVFRERGCTVEHAAIEFTDPRYVERFSRFPMARVYLDVFGMLPAQMRRATGQIRTPDEASHGGYDLVCIGSPTWWLTTCMPIRSFLKSRDATRVLRGQRFAAFAVGRRYWRNNLKTVEGLGTKQGGEFVHGTHFTFAGGQVRSMLALISFLGKGENRERYLGVRIPPTNLKPDYIEETQRFANGLADRLAAEGPRTPRLAASASPSPT